MKAHVGLLRKFLATFSKNHTLAIFFFKGKKYVSTSEETISKQALLLTNSMINFPIKPGNSHIK